MDNTRIEILEDRDDRQTFVAYIDTKLLPNDKAKEYIAEVAENLKAQLRINDTNRYLVTLGVSSAS